MRHSKELQSILSRFGAGPAPKDEVVQYLTRQPDQSTERQGAGILDDLENEGYVEIISGETGEFVRFTDKAIDEVFD
jgi:hypothetical protein